MLLLSFEGTLDGVKDGRSGVLESCYVFELKRVEQYVFERDLRKWFVFVNYNLRFSNVRIHVGWVRGVGGDRQFYLVFCYFCFAELLSAKHDKECLGADFRRKVDFYFNEPIHLLRDSLAHVEA